MYIGHEFRIQNNFNGFSLIDVHQNATLSDSFEGKRSRVIGNRCNMWVKRAVLSLFCYVSDTSVRK